ncbi:DUF2793 domain-containing protein [Microbulbifer sp. SSSA007]|uniref:DUF2793 domain-containing protein n=1 Tax=Microbulbifer sp. SSSA007 TaxID=3243379 RepID=UPI00403A49FA
MLDPAASLNQALDTIDALLQMKVLAIPNDPSGSASDGDRYIVATGIGAWVGKDGQPALCCRPRQLAIFPRKSSPE